MITGEFHYLNSIFKNINPLTKITHRIKLYIFIPRKANKVYQKYLFYNKIVRNVCNYDRLYHYINIFICKQFITWGIMNYVINYWFHGYHRQIIIIISSQQRVNYIQSPSECHATPAVFPKLNRNYHDWAKREAPVIAWESFFKRYLMAPFRCYLNCAPFKRRRTLLHATDLDNRYGSRREILAEHRTIVFILT